MVDRLKFIADRSEVFGMVADETSQVWAAFRERYVDTALDKVSRKGVEVTDEALEQSLRELVLIVDHPLHSYLHIFMCKLCPQFHKIELPCILVRADLFDEECVDRESQQILKFKNVTLAFPIEGTQNVMYSVQRGIPVLQVMTSSSSPNLVLVDPSMSEVATASNVMTH